MPSPIRILVADDHPVVRDGLVAMLSTQPDFAVAGEASTGAEAVERAAALTPDVILLDLEMPGMDGVEALRQIRAARPEAPVIVFTAFDTDERIVSAVRAGARCTRDETSGSEAAIPLIPRTASAAPRRPPSERCGGMSPGTDPPLARDRR